MHHVVTTVFVGRPCWPDGWISWPEDHKWYHQTPLTNTNSLTCLLVLLIDLSLKIISMFHRKILIFMRKRRKLVKSHKSDGDKNAQILHLEELICDSHTQENLHDEEIAVTKIKTDPNYFFRYAKKHSICLNEIGPLMGHNKTLTSDKYEMCCSLLYQFNSVFTKPHSE